MLQWELDPGAPSKSTVPLNLPFDRDIALHLLNLFLKVEDGEPRFTSVAHLGNLPATWWNFADWAEKNVSTLRSGLALPARKFVALALRSIICGGFVTFESDDLEHWMAYNKLRKYFGWEQANETALP